MSNINILHICSYFNTSTLYINLMHALKSNGDVKQSVFIPMYKNQKLVDDYGTVRNFFKEEQDISFDYSYFLDNWERYFLKHRIKKSFKVLEKQYCFKDYNFVHAHSLLFNGGIAYNVYRRYKINYITAVRMTDFEVLKKAPLYKSFALAIMKNAKKVVFISESLKMKFFSLFRKSEVEGVSCVVIPNGINDYWYNVKTTFKTKFRKEEINFLYQGTLHKRKNIEYTIKMVFLCII